MEIDVYYNRGKQFLATARGHQIVADQPPEEGGSDAGMTPLELFLASLGSCAAYYEAEYLRTRNLRACMCTLVASKGDNRPG
jgi:putative redox protein